MKDPKLSDVDLPDDWQGWRRKVHIIIFGAGTPAGKKFDLYLLVAILASVVALTLESVDSIVTGREAFFAVIEWTLTIIFTIEFITRIVCSPKPIKYIFSFFGIVDLLSILPTYATLFFPGLHALGMIRAFRLLRVFKLLKLGRFSKESKLILNALSGSKHKLVVFLCGVATVVLILGTLMYIVEGGQNGYTSIPRSMYWAIVTLTTVGYGDITPVTSMGQFLAALIMMMGYGLIAVPTGIFSAELASLHVVARGNNDDDANKCEVCNEDRSNCLLYTSPSPRDKRQSRMPSSA